uniref:Uncharacterized protein MANES_06G099700 n=1 Tax=Rhizophora mucronata TaxID=61149 RepID=A0A2P2PQH3_RHIMU
MFNRCFEEGAEEFLVKPVKLSDVKRLKDFIMKGEGDGNGERITLKRKMQGVFSSSPPSPSPSLAVSSSQLLVFDESKSNLLPDLPPSSPSITKGLSKRPRLQSRD